MQDNMDKKIIPFNLKNILRVHSNLIGINAE